MTTEAYVRDPRFEPLMLGYRMPDGACGWVGQEHIAAFLAQFDWLQTAILCHHAQFDGLIFSHHFGVKPCQWFDTLAMGRLMVGNHISVALDNLAKHFGLGAKTIDYNAFRGRHWINLYPHERDALGAGCVQDVQLTWQLFERLAQGFPQTEYKVIDLLTRMFTEPKLVADLPLLEDIQREEIEIKQGLLAELGVTAQDLQSAGRFVELLEAEGVEVEYKAGKNAPIPAIAKTDDFMKELTTHENIRVATLAEARLEVRSTISENRAGRLLAMGQRGALSVYLKYSGAHTTRFAGGDAINFQNFPGGHRSRIRTAVVAPRGYLLATVDSAQGEARLVNTLAGQEDIVQAFREKRDIYAEGASQFYSRPINKKNHPKERQLGKIMELMLGFGAAAPKFRSTCRAGALGGDPIVLSEDESESAVLSYRNRHAFVVDYWKTAGRMIARIAGGEPIAWGPMVVETDKITLPGGLPLWYPDLQHDFEDAHGQVWEGWSYKTRRGRARLWGSKLVENVVQALHRVAVVEAILEIEKESRLPFVLMSHDDATFLIPDDQYAEPTLAWLCEKMRKSPAWLPQIPFDAEGTLGRTYAK